ncbi:transporter [soil metagenome]
MVAALLSLRFRVLGNTLARNPIQVVAVVLGTLQALLVLAGVVAGLAILVIYPQPVQQATVVIGGVALTLGWFLVPLVATGIEPTIDPLRLSPFPIPVGRLMLAMTLVGATWIPGIVTFLASIATALAWRETPAAAALALLCGAIATVICIVGSRLLASLSANLVSGRRIGQRIAVLVIAALVLLGPVALAVVLGLRSSEPFPGTAAVLGATPFGAIWSVPGEVVAGHPVVAAAEFAIALATLAMMLVIWRWSLLDTFRARGGGARAPQRGSGRLGVFRFVPATPVGAIAARSLIYWWRDPRFARQLILVPMMPVLLILLASLSHAPWLSYVAAPAVAGLLPLTLFAVVSYDGTAYALHLSTGVRGVDDRAGRAAGLLLFALPAVLVVSIVSMAVAGSLTQLPALFGITIGMLLSGLAVVSVSSASIVIPVARAGRNPFTAQAGTGMTAILGSYAVTGVMIALALPELALGIASFVTGSALLGWLALAAGVVWGAGSLAIGVRVGGGILNRTGPALLARMRRTGG